MFNFISQYGRVRKITFIRSYEGEADGCRVVMATSKAASQLQQSLFNQEVFGEFVQAALTKLDEEDFAPLEFELEDGSKSSKSFEDGDISCWPEVSGAPSKVDY